MEYARDDLSRLGARRAGIGAGVAQCGLCRDAQDSAQAVTLDDEYDRLYEKMYYIMDSTTLWMRLGIILDSRSVEDPENLETETVILYDFDYQ